MRWLALAILLAGCTSPPLTEITDVHVWLAEWSYEAPEDFYTYTSFLHCGDALLFEDGTGKLWLQGKSPKQVLINRLATGSDRIDGFSEEGYHTPLNLVSPADGHQYGVSLRHWQGEPYVQTSTRLMPDHDGMMHEITETVTLTKVGAVSMFIDRNVYGCD